ncbi:MAG TPA: thiamine pyrophosphate-binding protein [Vicinamibacteria bacterium]
MTGGDHIALALKRRGVRFLYTLCGGHISPILVSAKACGIRVIDVRHEATAVFAADATARLSGVPGVAAVTAGPGATNALTAVKNAQLAQSPVLLLGGATATLLRGRGALQDIDQMALMRPHVKWATRVARVRDLGPVVEEAFARASADVPGPVFVECPVDLLYPADLVRQWYAARTDAPARGLQERTVRHYVRRHLRLMLEGAQDLAGAGPRVDASPRPPPQGQVDEVASLLARAERPVLLVGSQALPEPRRAATLAAAVSTLGIPVYLSGMARGLLGAANPLQLRHHRKEALREADLVVLAGLPCDFRLDYGSHIGRRAVLVSANSSARELRLNRRPRVAVHGPPDLFLGALAAVSGPRARGDSWATALRTRDNEREAEIERQAREVAHGGLHPLRVCRAIETLLPRESVIVADGGDFVATASYVLRPRGPLTWLDPGVFGTLGVGAGFALAAKLLRPQAEVWLLYGDGSVGFSLAEADTFARHGVGVLAVVGNDARWSQIAREQVEVLGDDVGTRLRPTDYHRAADGLGAVGLKVDTDSALEPTLREAQTVAGTGRPVYVNVRLGRTDFRKGSVSM